MSKKQDARLYLTRERVIAALRRLKKIVEASDKPTGYDDTRQGSKNTECFWGLCQETKALWPREDRLSGRSPKYIPRKLIPACPMQEEKGNGSGCFWYCAFFQRKYKTPTKEEYLKRIDKKIAELEGMED